MNRDVIFADAMLIVAPEGRDASVLLSLLADVRIAGRVDENGDVLLEAIQSGDYAGAIITDEAITSVGLAELRAAVDRQPTWSDFPFIILVRRGQRDSHGWPGAVAQRHTAGTAASSRVTCQCGQVRGSRPFATKACAPVISRSLRTRVRN